MEADPGLEVEQAMSKLRQAYNLQVQTLREKVNHSQRTNDEHRRDMQTTPSRETACTAD